MRVRECACVAVLLFSSGAAFALSEAAEDGDFEVRDRIDRIERGVSMTEALRREAASRDEAEKRVELIRNIPPERIQDWIDGKLPEAELVRLTTAPGARQGPEASVGVLPRSHLVRLLLVGAAVLVLTFLYARQRRRERSDMPTEGGGGRRR